MKLKLRGEVEAIRYDAMGNEIQRNVVPNGITTLGWDFICDSLGNVTRPNPLAYIGIGWGAGSTTSFAAGQTDLMGASSDRNASTYYHTAGTTILTHEATWAENDPAGATVNIEINESACFLLAAGGTMPCRALLGTITKAPAESVLIRWRWIFSEI